MKPQDLIGKQFATEGENDKSPRTAFEIVGVFANDNQLELKQIRYNKKLSFRPLFARQIGFYRGKTHMQVPTAFGEVVW